MKSFTAAVVVLTLMILGGSRNEVVAIDRTHYIAFEEVEWNYAPSGKNEIEGYTLDNDA